MEGAGCMTINEAYGFIDKAAGYGSILGLETMTNLLKGLDNPQDKLKFVHIAGTNGKGSTAAFITHILAAAGLRVGRYISPSVFSYEEKIQITCEETVSRETCENTSHQLKSNEFGNCGTNAQLADNFSSERKIKTEYIKEVDIASLIEKIQYVCEALVSCGKSHPTVFEVETAMAMLYFVQEKCDIVVLEVGLGGKLDATNVIKTTECGVITSISMDHMEYLGDTLEKIAIQKAGIIKDGIQVAAYDLKEEAMKVIEETSKKMGADLRKADFYKIKNLNMTLNQTSFDYKERKNIVIKLPGINQVYNAVVAILTADALNERGYVISETAILKGLSSTTWRGRFEVIKNEPLFIIDGAHNTDAALSLAENIKIYLKDKKIRFIMGVLKDKDYDEILNVIKGVGEKIYTVSPNNSRALSSGILAEKALEKGIPAVDAVSVQGAV
ncbi:MAG: hypothetical protein K0S61_2893, partial [Anaerocolumna sp.]|nr:hypothetical protein [Anaerocolumna sp.]